ncbi:MAG: hypothetical protein E6H85_11800 [Chloroflexi bacterium]|nr:MAG: hypothetical protein E6H85_11800 [Chloroflexota bacterium]
MVFDPGKHPDPPNMWSDALRAGEQGGPAPAPPENAEGLADQYEWVGLDRAEARQVPRTP